MNHAEWSVASSYPSVASSCPSVASSYPSLELAPCHVSNQYVSNQYVPVPAPRKKKIYEFAFSDGNMAVSEGMMTRLCQEGHIFKMLLFGGNGFADEPPALIIDKLQYYGITKRAFEALVFCLRTNNVCIAYEYKLLYESIGGFKMIDKYHRKCLERVYETKSPTSKRGVEVINLVSDDEERSPV